MGGSLPGTSSEPAPFKVDVLRGVAEVVAMTCYFDVPMIKDVTSTMQATLTKELFMIMPL